jgi:hypothetical protein
MATLRIETVAGEVLAEVIWVGDRLLVTAGTDEVRLDVERTIQTLLEEPTSVVSGGSKEGQFVTVRKSVKAQGEGALTALADALIRKRITIGGQRVLPRMAGTL